MITPRNVQKITSRQTISDFSKRKTVIITQMRKAKRMLSTATLATSRPTLNKSLRFNSFFVINGKIKQQVIAEKVFGKVQELADIESGDIKIRKLPSKDLSNEIRKFLHKKNQLIETINKHTNLNKNPNISAGNSNKNLIKKIRGSRVAWYSKPTFSTNQLRLLP